AWSRARTIGLDGVYVLICKNPEHVHVLVYPDTPEQGFTDENARVLRKRLIGQLKKAPDAALAEAVVFVRGTVEGSLSEHQSASSSIAFGTIAAIVGAVFGAWLLLSLMRAVLFHGDAAADPGHVSLSAGFLAALFGTTAGHWMYDRVFRAHAP